MKTGMVVRMATADMLPHRVNYDLSRCVKACNSLHEAHNVRGILTWSLLWADDSIIAEGTDTLEMTFFVRNGRRKSDEE